jgi:nucleoside-triphosphatase
MKLILIGQPRSGKTTIVKRLVSSLSSKKLSGFYTEEILRNGERIGFELVNIRTGRRDILAIKGLKSPYSVVSYGVQLENLENFMRTILIDDAEIIFVDEVGKMECLSSSFRSWVTSLIEKPCKIVFTAPLKGTKFIEEFKRRPELRKVPVNSANRELVFRSLLRELSL